MNLFSKKKPEAAARMPEPDDKSSMLAEARQRAAIAGRGGRRSTILSRPSRGEAGTSSYSNSLLGQAG